MTTATLPSLSRAVEEFARRAQGTTVGSDKKFVNDDQGGPFFVYQHNGVTKLFAASGAKPFTTEKPLSVVEYRAIATRNNLEYDPKL